MAEDDARFGVSRRKAISLAARDDEAVKPVVIEEDIIDYTKVFSEKIGPLNFPPTLKKGRPNTANNPRRENEKMDTKLYSLPGNLSMDFVTSNKYFGDDARSNFFDRHRFLDYHSKIARNDITKPLERLYFENEKHTTFETVPFGPIRSESLRSPKKGEMNQSLFRTRFLRSTNSFLANDSVLLKNSMRRSGVADDALDEDEIDFEEEMMLKASQSTGNIGYNHNNYQQTHSHMGNRERGSSYNYDNNNNNNNNSASEPLNQTRERPKTAGAMRTPNNNRTSQGNQNQHNSNHNNGPPMNLTPLQILQTPRENSIRSVENEESIITGTTGQAQSSLENPTRKVIKKPAPPPSAVSTVRSIHRKKMEEMAKLQRSVISKHNENNLKRKTKKLQRVEGKKNYRYSLASTDDVYSSIILEDLFTKFNVKKAEDITTEVQQHAEASALRKTQGRRDDESVVTASTVSTMDLYMTEYYNETDKDYSRGAITSPRTKFIASCMQEKLNPRASLVLRKNMTKRLNLQHHGMGDKLAALLADSLDQLPYIEAINIADNMLTDDGMGPIILAAVNIPSLTELNLSQNEIGSVSSEALHHYLVTSTCPLQTLILNAADVDDFECAGFIEAVRQNKSLRELDLSGNLIGKSENLNTVMPDIITGSEAIADLLRSPECNLTKLHLQWNMIRLDGAKDLASSLAINRTLLYLDLSFNSLATEGGIVLGVSLLKNTMLKTLIVSNNSIDAKACLTICAGIIENRTLRKVVLDGNPIGVQGMKALMLIPILAGGRVKISAAKCNVTIKDPNCWFDFDKLIKEYKPLDMEDGFERAVCIFLLHLIAGHQT
jgi:hypothetical protein